MYGRLSVLVSHGTLRLSGILSARRKSARNNLLSRDFHRRITESQSGRATRDCRITLADTPPPPFSEGAEFSNARGGLHRKVPSAGSRLFVSRSLAAGMIWLSGYLGIPRNKHGRINNPRCSKKHYAMCASTLCRIRLYTQQLPNEFSSTWTSY
jgi:hypothetical protein